MTRTNPRTFIATGVVVVALGIGAVLPTRAQSPGWSVNPNEFAASMSVTSVLTFEGYESPGPNDRVGAFVNGQVRGVTGPIQVGDRWFFFLTVFGQANGERVAFKYYSEAGDTVHDIFETTTFSIDRILGTTATPFLLTADVSTSVQPDAGGSAGLDLGANFPEPFSSSTTIPFAIEEHGEIRVDVFNVLGRRVATVFDGVRSAGSHEVTFDASSLPGGRYYYRLSTPSGTAARFMTVVR